MLEKVYVIKDSEGRYQSHLNICANSDNGRSDFKWDYFSYVYPNGGHGFKENAELDVMRLRELNILAEYDLEWEVIELTEQELLDMFKKGSELKYKNYSTQTKEIKKGCIGKHRKLVREIYKKYKPLKRRLVA